ncbi:unnamed protein product [Brachionus calyciflorus]|uniref:Uncharacterized protein n=1 Tax=Brachionus calyciflorus TaxID=104777 RepID=A0A814HNK6_9BILA|nr:unnamed protein product [Brachionus calyciflorus]
MSKYSQTQSEYTVLFFDIDNTYVVIKKSKCITFDSQLKLATVYFPNTKKTLTGVIKKEGSKERCEKKC